MEKSNVVAASEYGLPDDTQIRIALATMVARGGAAHVSEIYDAVESQMKGYPFPPGSKTHLRVILGRDAAQAGYLNYDAETRTFHITPEGREYLKSEITVEEIVNVETEQSEQVLSSSTRGAAFENYILGLLKKVYPNYAWYHQGIHKGNERGLDLIGSQIGKIADHPQFIGVQVKFHAENAAPSQIEWLKFLAGCFARQIDHAVFITSGRLTSEQRREAGEARVVVIEGRKEITRIANLHGLEAFELFEPTSPESSEEISTEKAASNNSFNPTPR
jgi:hypothetical protein